MDSATHQQERRDQAGNDAVKPSNCSFNEGLERLSRAVAAWAGSSWAFGTAVLTIVVWCITGPAFHFSDTWQLFINTGTTIVTFLMVFLIQRSQNKDAQAIQIKLNELLASQEGASNQLINVEDMSEKEISALHKRFQTLSERLKKAADDCEPHSVAEAREAMAEAQGALHEARTRTQK